MARGGICARMGTFVGVSGRLRGGNYGRKGLCEERNFCPECLPQMSIVQSTLMSVIMQNLNEIRQSRAEL